MPVPEESLSPPSIAASLRYRRPVVRDLAWLVLDGAIRLPPGEGALATVTLGAAERAEFLDLLQLWDQGTDDAWLGPVDPRLRLGLYTERLIGAWLRHSRQIQLLATNWRLRPERITLGEADILVRRNSLEGLQCQLWELACKFYLGVPGRGWLGTSLNDSLSNKLARVRGHQLQLIHHPAFRSAWEGTWTARAWIAGWLLHPAELAPVRQAPSIPALWAEAGDRSARFAAEAGHAAGVVQWWLLPKRRWIRPVFADEPILRQFHDVDEAGAFLTSVLAPRERGGQPRPLMLAGIRRLTAAEDPVGEGRDVAVEVMRLLLVPPGWSERAAAMPLVADGGNGNGDGNGKSDGDGGSADAGSIFTA